MKEELAEKLRKNKEKKAQKLGKSNLALRRHNMEVRDFNQLAFFTLWEFLGCTQLQAVCDFVCSIPSSLLESPVLIAILLLPNGFSNPYHTNKK